MNGRVSYLQGMFTKNLHLQAVFSLVKMKTSMGPQDQDGCASKTPAPQRSTLDKVMSVKAWTNIGVRFWLNKSLRWIDSSFLDFFFVCSFQLLFGVDAKWEMRWLDYIVTLFKQKRKKSATNLLPGVQESAEASESGIPFDLHMINSRSCPSPHPNWPKERMANKKGRGGSKNESVVCFLALGVKNRWYMPIYAIIWTLSWGTWRVISNTFEWVRQLRGSRTSYGSNS